MDTPRSILVIDDNEDLCGALKEALLIEGFDVECAFDGARAIELISQRQFDVILCDVWLPDMFGEFVAKYAQSTLPAARIVVMSAYSDIDPPSHPTWQFLEKPFSTSELVGLLQHPSSSAGVQSQSV